MKYAITIIVVSVSAVLMYGLAHAFFSAMQTIAVAVGGGV